MKFSYWIVFFICVFQLSFCTSQNIKWRLEAPREVSVETNFEVNFILENAESEEVEFPKFNAFTVLQGPSISRSISIFNGSKSSAVTYTFVLNAKASGTFTIEPAIVVVKGKKMNTTPYSINITKPLSSESGLNDPNVLAKAELKISPTTCYAGQQLTAEYIIHYAENINMSSNIELPDFKGFFVQPLDVQKSVLGTTRVGDRIYESLLIDAIALFPQQAGMIEVGKAIFPIQKKANNIRSFFNPFAGYEEALISTKQIAVKVMPLPENAPELFCGAVGEYHIKATVPNSQVNSNEAFILNLVITGNGDSKSMVNPVLQLGKDFEVFPGKQVDEQFSINNNVLMHTRIVEYLVTPNTQGQFKIQPFINVFNPFTGKYENVVADEIPINVVQGKTIQKLDLYANDLKNSEVQQPENYFWWYIASAGFLMGSIFYFLYQQKRSKPAEQTDALTVKKRNAGKVALQKLSKVKAFMEEKAYNKFYKETGEAVHMYLQEKYNMATEDLNKQQIDAFLTQFKEHADMRRQYQNISSKAELSLYGGYNNPNMEDVFLDAQKLIEYLEMQELTKVI